MINIYCIDGEIQIAVGVNDARVFLTAEAKPSSKWQGDAGVLFVNAKSEQNVGALQAPLRRRFQDDPLWGGSYPLGVATSYHHSRGSSGENVLLHANCDIFRPAA